MDKEPALNIRCLDADKASQVRIQLLGFAQLLAFEAVLTTFASAQWLNGLPST
jgi:hypothetical protein